MKKVKIAVLGDGGWGTTLAVLLCRKGYSVCLWSAFASYARYLNRNRVNKKFLPGIKIPDAVEITYKLHEAIREKDLIILAVPSQYMRAVLSKVKNSGYPKEAFYLSATKGIEIRTLKRMSELIYEKLGRVKLAVLSGPTIAQEVARGLPTTAVIASSVKAARKYLQGILMTENFRLYTNSDVVGVELGGSLKNIIAIACGVSDGLGFGANTKAALLSRGLFEMAKLGLAMGAGPKTFGGITGLGDLVTTCISPYSRNRTVGEQIGKGKTAREIIKGMEMVAEGIPTAKSAYALSRKYKVEMPITKEIYNILYKDKDPKKVVRDLMTRQKREE
ncbi:MAG: NAD(P)-dependent glycerol-3-phosphate dehydrogenase [Candidatus Omnitrophica bacterium]|nr:NAD(P)-dependent glycerol-3-phosphate dehydrogenase [Candidatus Omnitrophota bacterium]